MRKGQDRRCGGKTEPGCHDAAAGRLSVGLAHFDLPYIRYRNIYYRDMMTIKTLFPLVHIKYYRDIIFRDRTCPDTYRRRCMPVPLDNQICFSLYTASLAINRTYKPMLDAMGITYPQYLVLNALSEEEGMTIGAIADRLALESSTVTPPVKRLEQAGLLERRRSKVDERQVHVWLTDAGRALLVQSNCLGETLMERSGMTPEQLEALNQQVRALRGALAGDS